MLRKEDLQFRRKYTDENGTVHYVLDHLPVKNECPHCGSGDIHVNGTIKRKITSLNPECEKVVFDVRFQRYRCGDCGKTWYVHFIEERKKFTPVFEDYIITNVLDQGKAIKNMADKTKISFTTARNIIVDELNARETHHHYILPEKILLHQIKVKGKDLVFLIDPQAATLLDLLDLKRLEELKNKDKVKVVYARDSQAFELAEEYFPNAEARGFNPSIIPAGVNVLLEEGVRDGISKKLLNQYFKTGDQALLPELSKQSIKIIPIKVAYDFLMNNSTDVQKLASYDGELKSFKDFVRSLEKTELPKGFIQEGVDLLCEGISDLKDEISRYVSEKKSVEIIRKLVLFPRNACYPVDEIPLEEGVNFGRPIINID